MSEETKKSLQIEDIVTERELGRRSALGVMGATLLGAAAVAVGAAAAPGRAEAQYTDSDSGPNQDPRNGGRGGRGGVGCTDGDRGRFADPANRGRCARNPSQTGCTDSDAGRNADAAGRGRRC